MQGTKTSPPQVWEAREGAVSEIIYGHNLLLLERDPALYRRWRFLVRADVASISSGPRLVL